MKKLIITALMLCFVSQMVSAVASSPHDDFFLASRDRDRDTVTNLDGDFPPTIKEKLAVTSQEQSLALWLCMPDSTLNSLQYNYIKSYFDNEDYEVDHFLKHLYHHFNYANHPNLYLPGLFFEQALEECIQVPWNDYFAGFFKKQSQTDLMLKSKFDAKFSALQENPLEINSIYQNFEGDGDIASQGWKIHVSVVKKNEGGELSIDAESLQNILAFIIAQKITHKCAITGQLMKDDAYTKTQGGKNIVIYPQDEEQLKFIVKELKKLSSQPQQEYVGPAYDYKITNNIYIRYGLFIGNASLCDPETKEVYQDDRSLPAPSFITDNPRTVELLRSLREPV